MLARPMARLAGDHHDLLAIAEREPLEADVLEFDVHRLAGVQLQGEDARAAPRFDG